jgi:hypothetical protein
MAISMDLPASGFRFFVSVYRGEHERAFSELEAMVFGEFCQHLMQLWQQRVWESLGLSQAGEGDQRALCDAQGRLIYLGSAVAQTLARHLQDWQGEVLPGEWLATGPAPACCPWARARRCGCSARASCWRCRSGRPPRARCHRGSWRWPGVCPGPVAQGHRAGAGPEPGHRAHLPA